jgi:hypothetical protein
MTKVVEAALCPSPALFRCRWKSLLILVASIGLPVGVVNTSPVSVHLSPAAERSPSCRSRCSLRALEIEAPEIRITPSDCRAYTPFH